MLSLDSCISEKDSSDFNSAEEKGQSATAFPFNFTQFQKRGGRAGGKTREAGLLRGVMKVVSIT